MNFHKTTKIEKKKTWKKLENENLNVFLYKQGKTARFPN